MKMTKNKKITQENRNDIIMILSYSTLIQVKLTEETTKKNKWKNKPNLLYNDIYWYVKSESC